MEILLTIDKFLQMAPVRWLLLVIVCFLAVVTTSSLIRQKALSVELAFAKSAIADYVAAATVAEIKRKELEGKVATAAQDIEYLRATYETRIDKINKTKITKGTCAEMVAESVRILQDGD